MTPKFKPTYPLAHVQQLVRNNRIQPSYANAIQKAYELGISEDGIREVLLALTVPLHFHKSEPDRRVKGHWYDIYKCTYCEQRLYIKFGIRPVQENCEYVVLTSFKHDEGEI